MISSFSTFQNMENILNEAKISVVKRGTNSKRSALAGASAMGIAKEKNPAIFKLYQKHNLLRKQLKKRIFKQYGAMGKAIARKKIK